MGTGELHTGTLGIVGRQLAKLLKNKNHSSNGKESSRELLKRNREGRKREAKTTQDKSQVAEFSW